LDQKQIKVINIKIIHFSNMWTEILKLKLLAYQTKKKIQLTKN